MLWRRKAVERFGLFDDTLHYALDYEYWLRVGRHVPFHYLDTHVLAGSRLHADTKTLGQRVPAHLEIARVVRRYSPRPEPVLRWIKHRDHHKGFETASLDPINPAERRRFLAAMATHCLLYADELDVPVSDAFLAGLEADLASVDR